MDFWENKREEGAAPVVLLQAGSSRSYLLSFIFVLILAKIGGTINV